MALAAFLNRLRNIMRGDAGVGGDEQRLSQMIWILFLKIFDYKEEEWEATRDNYKPIIPVGYRWRDWAAPRKEDGERDYKNQLTGEELIDFVNTKLFRVLSGEPITIDGKRVVLLKGTDKASLMVREVMKESNNFMKNGVLLRQVIDVFDDINLDDMDERHAFNDIYETMLRGLQKNSGEFFTPRALTSLIVLKTAPKKNESVADFAAGTGGFLIDALNFMENQEPTLEEIKTIHSNLYGVEKKQLPYMLCTTNLLLHNIDDPNIIHGNTLETNVREYEEKDKFDVIIMNPPYGGSELDIVQKNFPAELRDAETSHLFMIEILYRLKENGRCGVILPDGFLFSTESNKVEIKKKLLSECNLHTVIRLPESCFAPYTDINTNLLFFDKTGPTENIWFYRFDLPENKKFSMTQNPITLEKLQPILNWWENREEIQDEREDDIESWKSKRISLEEIIEGNYSLDYCGFPSKNKVVLSPEETINDYLSRRYELEKKLDLATSSLNKFLNGDYSVKLSNIGSINKKLEVLNKEFPYMMRNSILQAAIQGKLTEQLSTDMPAEELFVKIQEEKSRLIKEGIISKGKATKEITEEEIEFEIPSNWKWVRLIDICEYIQRGKSPKYSPVQKYPVVAQKCNQWTGFDINKAQFIDPDTLKSYKEERILQNYDLLWNSTGLGTLGRMAVYETRLNPYELAVADSHVTVIRPIKELINPIYLFYYFTNPTVQYVIEDKSNGSTKQKELAVETVKNYLVPLPPLEEQNRIVDKVNQLVPLCSDI